MSRVTGMTPYRMDRKAEAALFGKLHESENAKNEMALSLHRGMEPGD